MQSSTLQKQIEEIRSWRQQASRKQEDLFRRANEHIEHAMKKVAETKRSIQTKQNMISTRNREAVYREANLRVNRGLESLARFIEVLREVNMNYDDLLTRAIHDPVVSSSLKEIARRAIASDFVKSIQKQLVVQTEFINIAAHELRTPIMPILTSVEMLEDELGQKNEWVDMIKRNALRLQRLTENILSVAKIESGSLGIKKELFDLNSLLLDIVKEESIRIENKNVRLLLSTKDKIYVNADKDSITRVVANLLDNAIKFTEEGIILITAERIDDKVVVSVSDDGLGINSQLFPVLFTRFTTMSQKGTGLGLYICKRIIEAHGGKMWAKNNDEDGKEGATFAFSLPL